MKENGRLYNKTIHTYPAQKEPWHELQKKRKVTWQSLSQMQSGRTGNSKDWVWW